MTRPRYYKCDGTPYEGPNAYLQWAIDFEKKDRWLMQERLWWGAVLSTIWLGLDHSFSLAGPPLIFESMIFFRDRCDYDRERYPTKTDAEAGHKAMKRKWSNPFRALGVIAGYVWDQIKGLFRKE